MSFDNFNNDYEYNQRDAERRCSDPGHKREPWYNDGDRVAGLFATMILTTVAIVICLGIIALAVKLFF